MLKKIMIVANVSSGVFIQRVNKRRRSQELILLVQSIIIAHIEGISHLKV